MQLVLLFDNAIMWCKHAKEKQKKKKEKEKKKKIEIRKKKENIKD